MNVGDLTTPLFVTRVKKGKEGVISTLEVFQVIPSDIHGRSVNRRREISASKIGRKRLFHNVGLSEVSRVRANAPIQQSLSAPLARLTMYIRPGQTNYQASAVFIFSTFRPGQRVQTNQKTRKCTSAPVTPTPTPNMENKLNLS